MTQHGLIAFPSFPRASFASRAASLSPSCSPHVVGLASNLPSNDKEEEEELSGAAAVSPTTSKPFRMPHCTGAKLGITYRGSSAAAISCRLEKAAKEELQTRSKDDLSIQRKQREAPEFYLNIRGRVQNPSPFLAPKRQGRRGDCHAHMRKCVPSQTD